MPVERAFSEYRRYYYNPEPRLTSSAHTQTPGTGPRAHTYALRVQNTVASHAYKYRTNVTPLPSPRTHRPLAFLN